MELRRKSRASFYPGEPESVRHFSRCARANTPGSARRPDAARVRRSVPRRARRPRCGWLQRGSLATWRATAGRRPPSLPRSWPRSRRSGRSSRPGEEPRFASLRTTPPERTRPPPRGHGPLPGRLGGARRRRRARVHPAVPALVGWRHQAALDPSAARGGDRRLRPGRVGVPDRHADLEGVQLRPPRRDPLHGAPRGRHVEVRGVRLDRGRLGRAAGTDARHTPRGGEPTWSAVRHPVRL